MGEIIRIGSPEGASGLSATIDTTGAWVTTMSHGDVDILYPRKTIPQADGTAKLRGGMHVCSPWFGDAAEPQHGPARQAEWLPVSSRSPIMNARSGRVEAGLILEWTAGSDTVIEGLRHRLEFMIMERRALRTELVIANLDGPRHQLIAPGFHPYFPVAEATTQDQIRTLYSPLEKGGVVISKMLNISAEERGETPTFRQKLTIGDAATYIESDLTTLVKWSEIGRASCRERV